MPRKICVRCKGQYGGFSWTNESGLPCPECAGLNRQDIQNKDEDARQKKLAEEKHGREMQKRRAELEAANKVRVEEEQTKRTKTSEEEQTKRVKEQQETERKRIEEGMLKMKLADDREARLEQTKQLEKQQEIEGSKERAAVRTAEEKTKQVKLQTEERTKQIAEEEKTKQMVAENEKLGLCSTILKTLAEKGTDKETLQQTLWKLIGDPEKVKKVEIPPTSHPNQMKVVTREIPKKVNKRSDHPRPRPYTGPVHGKH